MWGSCGRTATGKPSDFARWTLLKARHKLLTRPDLSCPFLRVQAIKFSDLGLSEPILRAVASEGYDTPTPIQAQAIPHVLAGRDVLGCAQTGTGKTAAFALPIIHRLSQGPQAKKDSRRPVRCLILSPTRELTAQIADCIKTYGKHTPLTHAVIFGGVGQNPQVRALQHGVEILVATPGRLLDLMQQGYADLRHVGTLVLDEADRMLDMGFINDIRKVIAALPPNHGPHARQTLLFSATMPAEIRHLAEAILRDPVSVKVAPVAATADKIDQCVYHVPRKLKPQLLRHLVAAEHMTRVVVFTRTKHGADRVAKDLNRAGINAQAIHGNKKQTHRVRTLASFKSGAVPVLVATDIAARGLDVDAISHVFNYDIPEVPETYVHRIGRTARAGASGDAIAFCDPEERDLLRAIERLTRQSIPVRTDHPEYTNIPAPHHAEGDDSREHHPRRQGRPQRDGRHQA
ncbi:MAG: DEAD/DEAH box helicase, partial [Phycisphaerales bacterium]